MADLNNLVATNPETGEVIKMLDGQWVPMGRSEQQLQRAPKLVQALAGLFEGATGGLTIASTLPGVDDFGAAAADVSPIATGIGFASTFGVEGIKAVAGATKLITAMGRGARARATSNANVAKQAGDVVTDFDVRDVPFSPERALNAPGGPAVTEEFKRRGFGIGQGEIDPNITERLAGAFKNLFQNVTEKSQIIRGIAGRRGPIAARQLELNVHALRGARGQPGDFLPNGGISRQGAGAAKLRNDNEFSRAIKEPLTSTEIPRAAKNHRKNLKKLPEIEAVLFKDLLGQDRITAMQTKTWRQDLSELTRSSNDLIRSTARDLIKVIDDEIVPSLGDAIDGPLWESARETWRFVEALLEGVGDAGGNVNWARWNSKILDMFPFDARAGGVVEGQVKMSNLAKETLEARDKFEFAGGVPVQPNQLSAIDFIVGGQGSRGIIR